MQLEKKTNFEERVPSTISVVLHWIGAIAVLAALSGGLQTVYFSPMHERWTSFAWHAYAGLVVLSLVVLRLVFRVAFTYSGGDSGGFTAHLASATHLLLYMTMILAPLSGWVAASGMPCCWGLPGLPNPQLLSQGIDIQLPANPSVAYDVHVAIVWSILGLVLLHVTAALLHHFVIGDRVLARMLPGRRRVRPTK